MSPLCQSINWYCFWTWQPLFFPTNWLLCWSSTYPIFNQQFDLYPTKICFGWDADWPASPLFINPLASYIFQRWQTHFFWLIKSSTGWPKSLLSILWFFYPPCWPMSCDLSLLLHWPNYATSSSNASAKIHGLLFIITSIYILRPNLIIALTEIPLPDLHVTLTQFLLAIIWYWLY